MSKVESAIVWMENTARDDTHGYDQAKRWGENGDFDCSAAVITAYQQAGVDVKGQGASYTGNMYDAFIAAGFTDVTGSVDLATGSGLQRGDVLLRPGRHTSMYCGNGKEVEASINEKGKVVGGQPGDQTGREFHIRNYYNYPWKFVLRFPEENQNGTELSIDELAQKVINGEFGNGEERRQKLGDKYDAVQAKVDEILGAQQQPEPAPVDIDALANDVIAGKYGNGDERRQKLGDNYDAVQRRVDEILSSQAPAPAPVDIDALARDVIAGKYGSGDERKQKLGDNYAAVQARVNEMLAPAQLKVSVGGSLWLRRGPSMNDEKLNAYADGTVVDKLGESNGWTHVRVQADGREGWMSSKYLTNA